MTQIKILKNINLFGLQDEVNMFVKNTKYVENIEIKCDTVNKGYYGVITYEKR